METALLDREYSFRQGFRSESRFWSILCWVCGAVSILKGLRSPNTWSATQAQLDYRYGFVKRGLFGAVVTTPLHLNHYVRFAVVSYAIFIAAVSLLLVLIGRSGIKTRFGHGEIVALFVSSAAVMYLGNLVGYSDILLLGATLALLLVRSPWIRFAAAVPVCMAAVMVHEAYLFMFLPIVLFSFFADAVELRLPVKAAWRYVAVLVCCCLGLTIFLAAKAPLTQALAATEMNDIAARVDFQVRPDFLPVLTRSFVDNVKLIKYNLRDPWYLGQNLSALILLLPVMALMMVYLRKIRHASNSPLLQGGFVPVCAGLAPLLMLPLGFDVQRWYGFTCVATFLVLLLLVRALPQQRFSVSPALRNATMLVMLLSMASGEGFLMRDANGYPFVRDLPTIRLKLKMRGLRSFATSAVIIAPTYLAGR